MRDDVRDVNAKSSYHRRAIDIHQLCGGGQNSDSRSFDSAEDLHPSHSYSQMPSSSSPSRRHSKGKSFDDDEWESVVVGKVLNISSCACENPNMVTIIMLCAGDEDAMLQIAVSRLYSHSASAVGGAKSRIVTNSNGAVLNSSRHPQVNMQYFSRGRLAMRRRGMTKSIKKSSQASFHLRGVSFCCRIFAGSDWHHVQQVIL